MDTVAKPRILVVDDTPQNIHILIEALKSTYAIVAATNGEAAIAMAQAAPQPELILLDVIMPGIDGYEVCQRLKQDVRTRNVPVIFVTSLAEEEDETRGLGMGAVDYITKPFRPSIVHARIRNHLELKKHRDQLQHLVEEQVEAINDSHITTIFAMSKLAESRDDDTGKHLDRTREYCRMLATHLMESGMFPATINEAFVQMITHASPLHDIGKVAIPDAILCKQGRLTEEEFAIMREHTLRGAETLASVAARHCNDFILMGLEIARSHHERWDGNGYPDKIAGEAIPLSARIMAVADVYDALTSKRCYKLPMSHEDACAILRKDSGTHFDPRLIDAFDELEPRFNEVRQRLQN